LGGEVKAKGKEGRERKGKGGRIGKGRNLCSCDFPLKSVLLNTAAAADGPGIKKTFILCHTN